ncbi:MAG: DUF1800 family protein [Alphaproteobacteria bacterium]|nr:DUF1800 family protein [Alphaproteobacteria bacterium]
MARDTRASALALHRFGLGPRAGTIEAIAADPRSALIAELDRPDAGQIAAAGLSSSAAQNRAVFEFNAERAAKDKLARRQREAAQKLAEIAGMDNPGMEKEMAAQPEPPARAGQPEPVPLPRKIFLDEAKARFDAATGADIGFVERLVWFWSNHFCVNADATVMAGGYEREAIRPHVLGRFVDMLQAVESHPAMLLYLNNAQSIGPDSVAGINRDKGLNENLSREILELHTLGARSGYSQTDVTNFAKVLTGWTIRQTGSDPDHGGEFLYLGRAHQPGAETVLGHDYLDIGVEQGRAVLADLARHPATARHVATKLARHFVADDPPPSLIDRLASRFIDTDGDLKEVTRALIAAPEAWTEERTKIKRPAEWITTALRATGINGDIQRIVGGLNLLGEPLWRPPAPKGFSDDNAAWLPGLAQRLDAANAFAHRVAGQLDPHAIAETVLGPLASNETREAIDRAESKPQALTILLMAPEFLRR